MCTSLMGCRYGNTMVKEGILRESYMQGHEVHELMQRAWPDPKQCPGHRYSLSLG